MRTSSISNLKLLLRVESLVLFEICITEVYLNNLYLLHSTEARFIKQLFNNVLKYFAVLHWQPLLLLVVTHRVWIRISRSVCPFMHVEKMNCLASLLQISKESSLLYISVTRHLYIALCVPTQSQFSFHFISQCHANKRNKSLKKRGHSLPPSLPLPVCPSFYVAGVSPSAYVLTKLWGSQYSSTAYLLPLFSIRGSVQSLS